MRRNGNTSPAGSQKNDTLKRRFLKQFRNSLRKLQRSPTGDVKELEMVREMSNLGTTNSCPICFDDYSGDPAEILMGKIKSCGHFYHFDCIWTWLEARGNCPLCREKVQLKEEDIQALALRHLLHDLRKNAQDHSLVNMTDSNAVGDLSNASASSEQVAVDVEPGSSPQGVVNDGFEDVDLESGPSVEFSIGEKPISGEPETDETIAFDATNIKSNDRSVSLSSVDISEVVVKSSKEGKDYTSSKDHAAEAPSTPDV